MAGETDFVLGAFELHRKGRFMTLIAFVIFEGRMSHKFLGGSARCELGGRDRALEGLAVFVVYDARHSVGCGSCGWHAVEEKRKPFLLFFSRATDENR